MVLFQFCIFRATLLCITHLYGVNNDFYKTIDRVTIFSQKCDRLTRKYVILGGFFFFSTLSNSHYRIRKSTPEVLPDSPR